MKVDASVIVLLVGYLTCLVNKTMNVTPNALTGKYKVPN